MFGLSNFIITEFLLIFYSLVTNVLYSYKQENPHLSIYPNNVLNMHISDINLKDEDEELTIKHFPIFLDHHVYGKYLRR